MFQHSHRGTIVWLLIIGLALVLSLVAGGVNPAVGAAMLAAYVALVWAVTRNISLDMVFRSLAARAVRDPEPSESAREASARARTYPEHETLIRLMDIGLIVDEPRPDGVALRRGRFISLDDDGIRPFAIIKVPAGLASRMAHIRFELRDGQDEKRYIYETEKWLEPGENALLPDYRLPVRKNSESLSAGGWSAQVYIDNALLGVHHFNLSESLAVRRRNLAATDGELRERVWRTSENDESLPLSLEEILRQQGRQRKQSS